MSLKTHENHGFAKIVTFGNEEIFLTEPEYLAVVKVVNNNIAVKFISFDDGSVALSDIRRLEILHQIPESRQLDLPQVVKSIPEVKVDLKTLYADRALPLHRQLTQKEFEEKKKQALAMARHLEKLYPPAKRPKKAVKGATNVPTQVLQPKL